MNRENAIRLWIRFISRPFPTVWVGVIPAILLLVTACTRLSTQETPPAQSIFFPSPPEQPRVQYLGSISSPKDLPRQHNAFADFILGPAPIRFPLAKPISAVLISSRLYICDTVFNTVLVFDMVNGEAHRLAGDRGNGKILQANNIAVDGEGRIYVADKLRGAVLVYGPDEQFLTAWGRPGEIQPVAVAVDSQSLYVCDIKKHQVEVWDRTDGALQRQIGEMGTASGQFFFPTQIALDEQGNIYVTDTGNFRIQKLSPDGEPLMQFGQHGTGLGHFAWPKGMDVDGAGRVYVADARFANVQIFDPQGRLLLFFGGPGPDRGNLDLPAGLRIFPWPDLAWLRSRLDPALDPQYLAIVVSQKGEGLINFFAVARDKAPTP